MRSATVTILIPGCPQNAVRSATLAIVLVVVHDLADDAGRNQACQTREIDGGLGLARTA